MNHILKTLIFLFLGNSIFAQTTIAFYIKAPETAKICDFASKQLALQWPQGLEKVDSIDYFFVLSRKRDCIKRIVQITPSTKTKGHLTQIQKEIQRNCLTYLVLGTEETLARFRITGKFKKIGYVLESDSPIPLCQTLKIRRIRVKRDELKL